MTLKIHPFRLSPTAFTVVQASLLTFALMGGAHPPLAPMCAAYSVMAVVLLVGAAWWFAAPDLSRRERVMGLLGIVAGLGLMLLMAAEVTGPRVSVDATVAQVLLLAWGAQTARAATLKLLSEPCSCP